ncbi:MULTISPECIES: his operon leader peptide [Enterobacteriaceae]|uniref:his operon leader peptide n=1 Tax=Dryocola boscaweniae TaxID=2925397 RepID=A0A9X3AQC2_9ENTR|nr:MULTISPECIES: his operon leader peptide [Enterobacteriaceae]MCT4702605.1 his operon leader peptide [Dryocola boscaweniae]MCT4706768.1 his operon leader peptide [Dryocola clanedunensis]MCT4712298.1 his operon leader peptide [Dryocola clanedunensis]MCT4716351.1 his operon leader peptide [Dryocola boscaweniae]MCT4719773.1 his operon leader peptide [Dryocola boscaweniae]
MTRVQTASHHHHHHPD